MHIPSVLSVPFNFIAKGFSRLSTTSGSVTRYQRHDTFPEPGRQKIRIFRSLISSGRKSHDPYGPFTSMAELRRRTYDESNCFHIRSRRFFGLRFRRSESAVASNYSKNITSVFLGDFQHLESNHGSPWLSRAPSTRPAARDSIAPDDDTASIRSTEESDSGSAIMIEGMFADVIAYADRLMGRLPEQLALSDAEAETEAAKNVMRPRSPGADSADRRPFKARVVDELLKPHQK